MSLKGNIPFAKTIKFKAKYLGKSNPEHVSSGQN